MEAKKKDIPQGLKEYNEFAKKYRLKYKEKHGVKKVPDIHVKDAYKHFKGKNYDEVEKEYIYPNKLSDEEMNKLGEEKKAKKAERTKKSEEKISKIKEKLKITGEGIHYDDKKILELKEKLGGIVNSL